LLCFYCYIFYVMYIVGALGVVDRMLKSFQFGYHDHVLDFLVENLDQRTFGLENVFTGLQLLQQWDDVIRMQRRYALVAWPDVRPASIMPLRAKLLEVKWASMFNLTLGNLRSSLGLTVLHTVMFSADGDVARWIIHSNPELLLVEDSQSDTPITIALKECAYFLIAYGEQNEGRLDDGTAYTDEEYAAYYPEVDDIRDELFVHGEFVPELCTTTSLTSHDLIVLREQSVYVEREKSPLNDAQAEKGAGATTPSRPKLDIYGNRIYSQEELKAQKEEKRRKQAARVLMQRAQQEKNSVFSSRFPEDDIVDDFEVGEMAAWGVVSTSVPVSNLFLDPLIAHRTQRDNDYNFAPPEHDLVHGRLVRRETLDLEQGLVGLTNLEAELETNFCSFKPHAPAPPPAVSTRGRSKKAKVVASDKKSVPVVSVDTDMQYVVRTPRRIHPVNRSLEVPFSHPAMRAMVDWDKRKKKDRRRGRRGSKAGDSDDGRPRSHSSGSQLTGFSGRSDEEGSSKGSVSVRSSLLDALSQNLNSAKADRDSRLRICKFAEILMSEEMSKSCRHMRWKVTEFKKFNRLASAKQGQVAQNLAMACNLKAPPGFVRVSDWSLPIPEDRYDEQPEEQMHMVVKGIVTLVGAAEAMAGKTAQLLQQVVAPPSLTALRTRGRGKQRRSTQSRALSQHDASGKAGATGAGGGEEESRMLNDRVVHFLAEALVCSTSRVNLDDAELSYNGRVGWRAIARALRRSHCSFILPSLFVPPKQVLVRNLVLTRNELDCGDAVYVADVLSHQLHLVFVDLSYNRIGARGMNRICIAIRDHPCIRVFKIDHNIIGPTCGKNLGIWLKKTLSLKYLSLSHNRMGEIVRFPTLYSREKIVSAVHDIFAGVKSNKSLEYLDLSYNHLGPDSGDVVPPSVNRHPKLHTLNFAGNALGAVKGTKFLFYLSGFPGGAAWSVKKEAFVAGVKKQQADTLKAEEGGAVEVPSTQVEDPIKQSVVESVGYAYGGAKSKSMITDSSTAASGHPLTPSGRGALGSPSQPTFSPSGKRFEPSTSQTRSMTMDPSVSLSAQLEAAEAKCIHPCSLTSISVADNQLDAFSGHAVASLLERNKGLTHLDLSGNSLGPLGGIRVSDQLELSCDIKPRDFVKVVLWEIEEKKFSGRNAKKRVKVYTSLTALNMSRNGIGPDVAASLFYSLGHHNCTLTDLDVSDNPLGFSLHSTGNATDAGLDIRFGIAESRSLRYLCLNRSHIMPMELVPVLGGLVHNHNLLRLELQDVKLDEPSCLQLCTALDSCLTLKHIDLMRCSMGANGSALVAAKLPALAGRLTLLNLSDNFMGPTAAVYLGEMLNSSQCGVHTLHLARNDMGADGGLFIVKALIGNLTVTDMDLSGNYLTSLCGIYLADAARGLFENGKKVADCALRRLLLNDNPAIGHKAARVLVKALGNDHIEHLELRNIGAKTGAARIVAGYVRDPQVAWKILDMRQNELGRVGLNEIFWAMRQNKRLRILRLGENKAGSRFCASEDALLKHGISVPRCIRANVVLRELDLSYNTLCTDAGINILDAMVDNHTIKKLSLRGNLIDDELSAILPDLLRCNNVLEELDLGHNRLGFSCAFALAEALEVNRSIKRLVLDYNRFGGAGTATLDVFCRSIMMNYSLQVLVLDGNKLGPQWGIRLAETFARNNTLNQVSLRDNRLDSRAGKALLGAYRHCPYLLELALSSDEVGNELWELFREQFELKRASTAPGEFFRETVLSATQSRLLSSYRHTQVADTDFDADHFAV
jgi:Ran GTPase-activating protein (RanGAP) involved in mRNA processing and transport